jgi:hypothetical protein
MREEKSFNTEGAEHREGAWKIGENRKWKTYISKLKTKNQRTEGLRYAARARQRCLFAKQRLVGGRERKDRAGSEE